MQPESKFAAGEGFFNRRLRRLRGARPVFRRRKCRCYCGKPRGDLGLARLDLRVARYEAGNQIQHLRRNDVAELLAGGDLLSRPGGKGNDLPIERRRDDLAVLHDQSVGVQKHKGPDEQIDDPQAAPARPKR